MLTIRREQLAVLTAAKDRDFARRLAAYARRTFPDRTVADDDLTLERRVLAEIETAKTFGLGTCRSVSRYVNLCLLYGWRLHEDPARRWMFDDYLADPSVADPDERLNLLIDQCAHRLEVAAQSARVHGKYPRSGIRVPLDTVPIEGEDDRMSDDDIFRLRSADGSRDGRQ